MLISITTFGQKIVTIDFSKFPAGQKMMAINREATVFKEGSISGVRLSEGPRAGILWLNDKVSKIGVIEFDVRGKDVLQKSFVGIAFHGVNDSTYEAIYFRPFNFHAKDSVRKIHAVQYISEPEFTWRKLRDERNGQYEKAVIPAPDPNGWFHAKVVVTDAEVLVFVGESNVESLRVTRLNAHKEGSLGLWVGDGSGGDFSNITVMYK
jgi:hypothetical protein